MKTDIFVRNEKGWAMPLALLVMVVIFLLGTALWYYSTAETIQVARVENRMKAHYLARSGAAAMAKWINENRFIKSAFIETELLGTTSLPVSLGEGTFKVTLEGTLDRITVKSKGTVGGVTDEVTITLNFSGGGLPSPKDISTIFPKTFNFKGGWLDGTNKNDPHIQWVEVDKNKARIKRDVPQMQEYAVLFSRGLTVEHQESQKAFSFYAKYILFENTPYSLYIKSGNTLNLHSDIIIFMGLVELDQPGGIDKQSEMTLNVLNGEIINGKKYGRVYFFDDVIWTRGNSYGVVIEKGAYYFLDGTIIRSTPIVIPSLVDGGLIPYTGGSGGSGSVWGN